MSFTRPMWTEGEPEALAASFVGRTEEQGKLLGNELFTRAVEAIASASVHNALAQASDISVQLERQVGNVMLTAQASTRHIAEVVPAELDDDGDDGEASSSSSTTSGINEDDDDDCHHSSKRPELIRVSTKESPLVCLETALKQVFNSTRADGHTGAAPGSTHAWLASYPLPLRLRTAASPSPSPPSSSSSSFPLPLHLLPDLDLAELLARLDGRTAASAASSCKRLRDAHSLVRFFELPPPFRCYLTALLAMRDDFSDGSVESVFNVCFPLDGSPVCGADLGEEAFQRRMAVAMPDMEKVFALLSGPGGRSMEDFRSSIPATEPRRLPAPHPQSSPLAFFRQSEAVPFNCSNVGGDSADGGPGSADGGPSTAGSASGGGGAAAAASGSSAAARRVPHHTMEQLPPLPRQPHPPSPPHRHQQLLRIPHPHPSLPTDQAQQHPCPPTAVVDRQAQRLPHSQPLPPVAALPEAPLEARPQFWYNYNQHHQQQQPLLPPPLSPVFSEPYPSTPPPTRPAIASVTPQRQLPVMSALAGAGAGQSASSAAAAVAVLAPTVVVAFPPAVPAGLLPAAGPNGSFAVPARPAARPMAPLVAGPIAAAAAGASAAAAAVTAPIATAATGIGSSRGANAFCCLANALCDVQELWELPVGQLHCDGDVLAAAGVATAAGWGDKATASAARQGAPLTPSAPAPQVSLYAVALGHRWLHQQSEAAARYDTRSGVGGGGGRQSSSPSVSCLCADSANGMVWAASAEGGGVVRGFQAPVSLASPTVIAATGAGCRRAGGAGDGGSGRAAAAPRHVLSCEVGGLGGSPVGVHVIGSQLLCVKSSGALLSWNMPNLSPYIGDATGGSGSGGGHGASPSQLPRRSPAAAAAATEWGDPMDVDVDVDGAASDEQDGVLFDDDDDDMVEVRPQRRRRRDAAGAAAAAGGGGGGDGTAGPHRIDFLQVPSKRGSPSAATLLQSLSRDADFSDGGANGGGGPIRLTRLLYDAAAPAAPTLAAALAGNIVVSYDLETRRVKQLLFGHLYEVTDIAPAPPAWRQSTLFATSARSGDVKIWDVRARGGSAAVTLTGGETWHLNSVVLASASGGSGGGGGKFGGSGGQLGAGMVCFAGGEGESIWAWDLRGGHARPMYELSTGNTHVTSMAWHGAGSSLFASCKSVRREWKPLREGVIAAAAAAAAAPPPAGGVSFGAAPGSSGGGGSSTCSAGGAGGASGGSSSAGVGSTRSPSATHSPRSQVGSARATSEGSGGGGGGERRLYWPARAKHQPADFGAYFSMARSCVLRYQFSEQASRIVPRSSQPHS